MVVTVARIYRGEEPVALKRKKKERERERRCRSDNLLRFLDERLARFLTFEGSSTHVKLLESLGSR